MNERLVGRIPVLESLRAGKRAPRRLFVLENATGLDAILEAAHGVPIDRVDRGELEVLAGGAVHQGVVLEAGPLPILKAEDWLRRAFEADAIVVMLDGVEDPHNFGAIVRSAAACGACGVLFGKRRSAPVSPASAKSAAGAMEYVDLVQTANVARTLRGLKEVGFWIMGLDAQGEGVIWKADLTGRVALVVGSEGKGMGRLVSETCDMRLRIPLTGPITSLNASVSAAVALAECLRQRQA
ncbi:MAG TPA: 23S rRNA (guanosine(2251)-2'-O)-methyltransferase RlmB [Candidatus Hydrogenedentes bacterium]|nr:23S rRNA (guanosine(2251)-2'-O)-methyltransferase RlmB [Candidatus Hydrogenedentota bacterium]HPG69962.1 23S rRNA (guanosine(2251)-2'-O)-methyltransferase RlmB [Candidatus Hydrogenedentota bacterium]